MSDETTVEPPRPTHLRLVDPDAPPPPGMPIDDARAAGYRIPTRGRPVVLPPLPPAPPRAPGGPGEDGGASSSVPKPATPHTDLGNAERFARDFAVNFRYCKSLGGWFSWDSARWARDATREAERCAHETVRRIYTEADPLLRELAETSSPERRAELEAMIAEVEKHGKRSEHASRLAGLLSEARSILPIPVAQTAFDGEHTSMLLNCQNGTLDLASGYMREHRREDLITMRTGAPFDENATAPRFEAFLEQILPDPDVRAWMQRWAGYVATGVIREHLLPVWWGDGANGKGTLAELLKGVLGDYAVSCPEGFFEEQKHQGHATEIARLRGARFAIGSETKQSSSLAESKIKRLTGGDTLTGRFMREDFFDFKPTAKFVLFTNYKPRIKGNDNGIRRRVVLVPFTVTIPEKQRDPKLCETLLRTEAPGILRWIIEGTRVWLARGSRLDAPDAIRAATQEYLESEDIIARFLEDACTVRQPGDRLIKSKPATLFAAFTAWCSVNGEKADTAKGFAEMLASKGYHATKSHGDRWYFGLAPLANEQGDNRYAD